MSGCDRAEAVSWIAPVNEVSASIFHYYHESAQRHALPFEAACAEIPTHVELLSHRRRWYDWEDHRRFLLRLESLWGREKLEWLASQVRYRRAGATLVALARGFTRPYLLYWAGFKLVAPTLYRHIRFSVEERGRDRLRAVIEIPEPHGELHVFFYPWVSTLQCTPALLGLPDALVNAELGGRRGVFDIRLPQSQTWSSRIGRRLSAMSGSRALVEALERDRKNLQEALEHQLRVERDLIKALPDAVLRLAVDGTLMEVMGDAAHALAEPLRALRGQRLSGLSAHFPGADAALLSLHEDIAAAVAERRPKQRSVVFNAGTQQAFFDWRFVPDGEQVLAIVRDVSVERRLEGRLLTADRMASVGLLAASITHEINNPLTYVLGNLELLELTMAAGGSSEPGRAAELQQVRTVREGAARIAEIVRGLRSFSRPAREQAGPVDVNAVLDAMLQLTSNVVAQRARVVKQYGSVPPVHAVEGRLGQVFVNLLVNAAQAIPERVGTLGEIRIRTFCAPDDRVAIEIRDDGSGIAPERLPYIFEPFFTTKGTGTGLGLFIAQHIVLDLEGMLEVESAPGEGTTLRVTLPVSEQERQAPAAPTAPAVAGGRRNVLVIEDQEPIALAIKLMLGEHEVTLATRGDQALRLLMERNFDVVLCDVMMPGMSGPELYRQLAAARPGYERRFVFMTGGAFTDAMQRFLATTVQPCLEKPFGYTQVQEAIRSLGGAG